MKPRNPKVDPLYQLFEHYIFQRSYEDSAAFTKELAEIYLGYLDSTPAHVPFHCRDTVLKDLESEAHEMLVKMMYGCAKEKDYVNVGQVVKVAADLDLSRVGFEPPTKDQN